MIENKIRLLQIFHQITELLFEAKDLFKQEQKDFEFTRTYQTWYGRISASLGGGDFVDDYETFKKEVYKMFPTTCCEDMNLKMEKDGEYHCVNCNEIFEEEDCDSFEEDEKDCDD